jgi:hypothetical protein
MPDPLVIPVGFAQATFRLNLAGRAKPFTFSIGAQLGADEASLASELDGWFGQTTSPGYAFHLSPDYETFGVEVIGHSAFALANTPTAGVLVGQVATPAVAVKIEKVTNQRGRANRGAMFWPGVLLNSETDDAGDVGPTAIALFNTIAAGLTSAMSTDGSAPVILHHMSSSTTTPTPINALVCHSLVHTQRRRQQPR